MIELVIASEKGFLVDHNMKFKRFNSLNEMMSFFKLIDDLRFGGELPYLKRTGNFLTDENGDIREIFICMIPEDTVYEFKSTFDLKELSVSEVKEVSKEDEYSRETLQIASMDGANRLLIQEEMKRQLVMHLLDGRFRI